MEKQKVFEILKSLQKRKKKFFLWTFRFDELIKVEVWISDVNFDCLKIGYLTKRFKVAEAVIGSRKNIFFFSPSLRVAFVCKLNLLEGNELEVAFPEVIELIDYRKNSRLNIDLRFQINIKGKMYNFNTFDIGVNGISIILKEQLKPLFKMDSHFAECFLYMDSKKIRLSSQVKNIVKMSAYEYNDVPYGFFRVGLEFVDLNPKMKYFLNKVIESKKNVG